MSRRQVKHEVTHLLLHSSLPEISRTLPHYKDSALVNALFTCLCHPQEIVRWHAVSSFGMIVQKIAGGNLEDGRVIMRRFLWMLNDESGGIGWTVPEAMGEVMAVTEPLAQEYGHMLVSYTLDDGPELFQDGNFLEMVELQRGVLWGLYRMAPHHKALLLDRGVAKNLAYFLDSADVQVRGMACLLCSILELSQSGQRLSKLCQDRGSFRVYLDGQFSNYRIADVARTVATGGTC